jgi:UDP-glucose 4-epimerase
VLEVAEGRETGGRPEFPIHHADRRPGDPAMIVAAVERIRMVLGWNPRWNNLDTIAAHALAWERRLASRGCSDVCA